MLGYLPVGDASAAGNGPLHEPTRIHNGLCLDITTAASHDKLPKGKVILGATCLRRHLVFTRAM